jgi:hypothetical protein
LYVKTIVLPRQARDNHRESTENKDAFSLGSLGLNTWYEAFAYPDTLACTGKHNKTQHNTTKHNTMKHSTMKHSTMKQNETKGADIPFFKTNFAAVNPNRYRRDIQSSRVACGLWVHEWRQRLRCATR